MVWRGNGGSLEESDLSGNFTDEYIYFGGKRIAHKVVGGDPYYYAEDLLGTSRVISTWDGTTCYDADFYPFGGERVVTNTCAQNYKFEGKERDTETNNDDFGARYYSSRFGRWLSPDWSSTPTPVPYAHLTNPQTLNLYTIARDNPETFADLDGHDLEPPVEYGGSVTVAGPGEFGPPPTMTAVNNLSDFGENYYGSPGNDQGNSSGGGLSHFLERLGNLFNSYCHFCTDAELETKMGQDAFKFSKALELAGVSAQQLKQFSNRQIIDIYRAWKNGKTSTNGIQIVFAAAAVLQTGGNTIRQNTAKALNDQFGENLSSRDWGRALERMKSDNGLPNDFHGRIMSNGDFINPETGETIGNLGQYIP